MAFDLWSAWLDQVLDRTYTYLNYLHLRWPEGAYVMERGFDEEENRCDQ